MYIGRYISLFLRARKALRESRGIALLCFRPRHENGVRGHCHTPTTFYPWEKPGTHCTGGWVGPRAGLDRCRKSCPPSGLDPRTFQPVASRYTDVATRHVYWFIHKYWLLFLCVLFGNSNIFKGHCHIEWHTDIFIPIEIYTSMFLKMDAWHPKQVEDYDTIKCLWKWKYIKLVTLLWLMYIYRETVYEWVVLSRNRYSVFIRSMNTRYWILDSRNYFV
jgi:hypothetical protein